MLFVWINAPSMTEKIGLSGDTIILAREGHPQNGLSPMSVRLSGKVTDVSAVQSRKELPSRLMMPSENVAETKLVLSVNTPLPIAVTLTPSSSLGISKSVASPAYFVIFAVPSSNSQYVKSPDVFSAAAIACRTGRTAGTTAYTAKQPKSSSSGIPPLSYSDAAPGTKNVHAPSQWKMAKHPLGCFAHYLLCYSALYGKILLFWNSISDDSFRPTRIRTSAI